MSETAKMIHVAECAQFYVGEDLAEKGAAYLAGLKPGQPAQFEVPALLLKTGEWRSCNAGLVKVDRAMLDGIAAKHSDAMRAAGGKLGRGVPVQLDHQDTSAATVGRLHKPLRIVERPDGAELHGTLTLCGADAIACALDGRYRGLSAGFRPSDLSLVEVSLTPFPAVAGAEVTLSGVPDDSVLLKKVEHDAHVARMAALESELAELRQWKRDRETAQSWKAWEPHAKKKEEEERVRLAEESRERRERFKEEARVRLKSPHAKPLGYQRWE